MGGDFPLAIRARAPDALFANGTRIEGVCGEMALQTGTVLGSFSSDVIGGGKRVIYYIEWDARPNHAVATSEDNVRPAPRR